jgi:hypothetical protein
LVSNFFCDSFFMLGSFNVYNFHLKKSVDNFYHHKGRRYPLLCQVVYHLFLRSNIFVRPLNMHFLSFALIMYAWLLRYKNNLKLLKWSLFLPRAYHIKPTTFIWNRKFQLLGWSWVLQDARIYERILSPARGEWVIKFKDKIYLMLNTFLMVCTIIFQML